MKAPNFDFVQPSSVDEVVAVLSDKNTFIKVLSGGQSLCPMMNFRLVRPELIVDISRIKSLKLVDQVDSVIKIGSGVTHSRFEDGVVEGKTGEYLKEVASGIAYRAVRTRGTIGGSLVHADPAADWPAALMALGARIEITGPKGARIVDIGEFLLGPFTTRLDEDELVVAIHVPRLSENARWSYVKTSRKPGEFAQAIAVLVVDEAQDIGNTVVGATHTCPVALENVWDGENTALVEPLLHGLDEYGSSVHLAALRKAASSVHDVTR